MPPSTGYASATPDAAGSTLTGFSFLVDLANLPAEWWAEAANVDATRGRVFLDDGATELAVDWIDYDHTAETGLARINHDAKASQDTVRIYPPVAANATVAASATYGSDNAYNAGWLGYWPEGGAVGTDRTSNAHDLTPSGSPATTTGPFGTATDYTGTEYADSVAAALIALPQTYDWTVMAWINPDVAGTALAAWAFDGADDLVYYPNDSVSGAGGLRVFWRDLGGAAFTIDEAGSDLSGAWAHNVMVSRAADDHEAYRDAASIDTTAQTGTAGLFSAFRVGSFTTTTQKFNGQIGDVQVHGVARSVDWIAHEYAQANDNAAFWNTWSWTAGGVGGTTIRQGLHAIEAGAVGMWGLHAIEAGAV
jgi:hypothetical protein